MQLYFILSLIAAIIVVIFAVTNAAAVPVRFFFAKYELSLALIIFISTALGAIIAAMLGFVKHFKLKKQIKKLTTENQTLILENTKLQEIAQSSILSQSTEPSPEEKTK
ncbi:MAG: uncharacterized protein K0R09_2869 [Clostridiales bacterium]|nr:uncharacterized protein [Clostridiales bacterium]